MNPLAPAIEAFDTAQQALFVHVVQPVMFGLGLGNLLEEGFVATAWLLVGLLQLLVMVTLIRGLERWRPAEPLTDRASVRDDIVYTLLHRLGLFRVAMFFSIDPLWDSLAGWLRVQGVPALQADRLWPGVTDQPLASFVLYLLLFDLFDYAYHRSQHRIGWWWQLHALHHSQRQLTMWSDNRNHLLDDMLRDSLLVLLAHAIGVAPGQFIALVAVTQLLENLSHANVRLDYGPLRWLLVSPHYHRVHHAVGLGHEAEGGHGTLGGCNFGVLFPVWDLLFGTARFGQPLQPTGIRDQLEGRDYGHGFWSQQWLGLKRLVGRA